MKNPHSLESDRVGRLRCSLLGAMLFAALILGGTPSAHGQAFPGEAECSLFSEARLVTMDGGEVAEPTAPRDVLVCGEQIKTIGEPGTVKAPEGATVLKIDAAGHFLLPGLVDGHVHLFAPPDLKVNLAWGVTGVRNLFGNPMALGLREQLSAGTLLGPRLWTAGPIVDGDPPIWPGSAAVTTAEEARAAVKLHLEAGYDFIKLYSLLMPEPFFAAIEAAKEAGVKVGGHVPIRVPLADAAAAGMDFIEHLTGFLPALQGSESKWLQMSEEEQRSVNRFEGIRMQVEGFDEARLPAVAEMIKKNGVWNIPTFVVLERISAPLDQKTTWLNEHPQMRTTSPMAKNMWNPQNDFRLRELSEEDLQARQRSAELHYPIVKALHDAGAELMLGTDTPNPFVYPGYSVHEELERFVKAGLTPWQALRTATVQPARYLDREAVFGRIKEGLSGDLVLLTKNPLEDISNSTSIAGVMTRGRWLDRTKLDAEMNALAKAYGNP